MLISIEDIGNDFYTYGGYNEWAESNNIIVVYPQAVKSEFMPMNPSGCFDWWGYTDANVSTAANLFCAINVAGDIP
jgi:poly(3-hydroxybutyrate) depolymerase